MARVLLFAAAKEAAGCRETHVDGSSVAEVLATLRERFGAPFRDVLSRSAVFVDDEAVAVEQWEAVVVDDATDVAVLPPVSGGAVGTDAAAVIVSGIEPVSLDVPLLIDRIRLPHCGGVVSFEGTTRGETGGRWVQRLEYEAYERLAQAQLHTIATEVAAQFGLGGALAVHRTGRVGVGEAAVVVAASAPHRAEAFDAARVLIDRVKAEVAIWKREVFAEGAATWVGCEPDEKSGETAVTPRPAPSWAPG